MAITILTEAELRSCVTIDAETRTAVASAFTALARGEVIMPPILRIDVDEHNGEVDVKSAYMRGLNGFAVKIASGFFDNPTRGLPSTSGMMNLFDSSTGRLVAVHLDNGYLTDVRPAAAGAVAAEHLAPREARTVGVVGAGAQARMQIQALKQVRDFSNLLVWARDGAKARRYADEMADLLGVAVAVCEGVEPLVRQSDIVVTATPATSPLIEAAWLHSGLHITAMGSDAEHKNELAPGVMAAADLVVCDSTAQCLRLGELHHAVAAGAMAEEAPVVELGQITGGRHPGRGRADEVTVCDLTGTGVQDTAIALLAFEKAKALGLGTTLDQ